MQPLLQTVVASTGGALVICLHIPVLPVCALCQNIVPFLLNAEKIVQSFSMKFGDSMARAPHDVYEVLHQIVY